MTLSEQATELLEKANREVSGRGDWDVLNRRDPPTAVRLAEVMALVSIARSLEELLSRQGGA